MTENLDSDMSISLTYFESLNEINKHLSSLSDTLCSFPIFENKQLNSHLETLNNNVRIAYYNLSKEILKSYQCSIELFETICDSKNLIYKD